jgi:enterochelin esterase-like enzyme
MKKIILFSILSVQFQISLSQTPSPPQKPSTGEIRHYENFKSNFVTSRNVDVWLPNGYSQKRKYAVLYMHDGQMLFDSTTTWNKQEWGVDEVVSKLIADKKIKDCIVVGVFNGSGTRHADYFPQKPYERLTQLQRDTITTQLQKMGRTKEVFKPISDNYLKFLVTELKPFIDKKFSTKKEAKNTFVAGSSMGGLISMYAICKYPNVFGGAACLSTHWPGIFSMQNNPIPDAFVTYLKTNLPNPEKHKLYFDYGTATLDALYEAAQLKVDAVMTAKGWTSKNWITRKFEGADHSEKSWRKRLNIPLEFLLSK